MKNKKNAFKILSVLFFAVAAGFLALSIFVGVKYYPTPQPLNKKVTNSGAAYETDETEKTNETDEQTQYFKYAAFTVAKSGAIANSSGSGAETDASGSGGASTGETDDSQ